MNWYRFVRSQENNPDITQNNKISVWLDDLRPMPSGFSLHVKTAQECINVLREGNVEFISFDHDLGPPEAGTGYEVAKFIEQEAYNGNLEPLRWTIHSANPVGKNNIATALSNADRYWQKHSGG